jgi:tetratricopeptide (TPR) repeat protein
MGTSTSPEDLRRLMRVAAHATDRERLFIQGSVAAAFSEPRQLAIAETLSVRYPAEPDGHFLRGSALVWSGDFLGAIPWLRRVVAMDSVGLTRAGLRCRACDAFEGIVNAYLLADSAGAAERTARQWIRQQPMAGRAWTILSQTLELQGRYREAIAVRHHAATLNPVDDYDAVHPAMIRIRAGDFTGADRLLGELARDGTPAVQSLALWFQLISLRNQGRLRAAMAILDKGPRPAPGSSEFVPLTEMRMQVLLEMGRPRDAAALVEPLARTDKSGVLSGIEARRRAWNLTHLATALMAARDTGRIPSLADTLELLGKASAFGRDGLLHHYVRGLLLEARQHPESAAVELRRAIYSPTIGYTRVNYELGKLLIRLRRPREAIATLQPSLRGGLEASNLYVTRSDLHELLGQAWEQERRGDSATVHYSAAANAWSNADASFHARRAMILDRLARLERGGSIR